MVIFSVNTDRDLIIIFFLFYVLIGIYMFTITMLGADLEIVISSLPEK